MSRGIHYADKYVDFQYEYRHVILPKEMAKGLPKQRLLGEDEWRGIGVQQSRGWHHYLIHQPEPHILCFRRPHGTIPETGEVDPMREREDKMKAAAELGIDLSR